MVATRLTPCKWTQRGHEEWRGWRCMIIRSQSVITKAAVARGLHGVVIVSLRNLFIHLPLLIIFACLYKLRKVTPLRSNPLKRLVRLRSVFGLLSPCKWVQFFSSSFSQGEIIRKASIFLLLLLDRSLIKFWFHFKINILIISKEYSFNEIVKIFGDKKLTMRSSYLSNLPSSFYFRFFNERRRVINWSFFFFLQRRLEIRYPPFDLRESQRSKKRRKVVAIRSTRECDEAQPAGFRQRFLL